MTALTVRTAFENACNYKYFTHIGSRDGVKTVLASNSLTRLKQAIRSRGMTVAIIESGSGKLFEVKNKHGRCARMCLKYKPRPPDGN